MYHHGADEELIEEVLSMRGTVPLLFKEIGMRAHFLKIMRNDLRLLVNAVSEELLRRALDTGTGERPDA